MRDLAWLATQVQGGLRIELIAGVACYVLGPKVQPMGVAVEPIWRAEAEEPVGVVGGYYHRPGCRHGDQGMPFVPLVQAIAAGHEPCTALPRRPPRMPLPIEVCPQCGAALSVREQTRGRCDDCSEAAERAA